VTIPSIHPPTFGVLLKERMDALGIECTVRCAPDAVDPEAEMAFLRKQLCSMP